MAVKAPGRSVGAPDERIDETIDVRDFLDVKWAALQAHRTDSPAARRCARFALSTHRCASHSLGEVLHCGATVDGRSSTSDVEPNRSRIDEDPAAMVTTLQRSAADQRCATRNSCAIHPISGAPKRRAPIITIA